MDMYRYTVHDAARRLDVHPNTIYNRIKSRKLGDEYDDECRRWVLLDCPPNEPTKEERLREALQRVTVAEAERDQALDEVRFLREGMGSQEERHRRERRELNESHLYERSNLRQLTGEILRAVQNGELRRGDDNSRWWSRLTG